MKLLLKKTCFTVLFISMISLFSSCENDDITGPGESLVITPLVRPKGTNAGIAVTKKVGPEGGQLKSSDGSITVDIPQGALTAATTVSIEPVSNTNIAGIGKSYRLLPHGQVFAKPVTITSSWAGQTDSVGLLQTLGFAYQMDDGVWKFVGAHNLNTTGKTVSFKTTHFSDWSLMNRISLSPYKAEVETGNKLSIRALIFTEADWDNLFVPLVNNPNGPYNEPGYPVGTAAPLPSKFIKSWTLTGQGNLTRSTGQTVEYQAPAAVNGSGSATVSLELNAPVTGSFHLLSDITIMGDSWVELSINGSAPVKFPVTPVTKLGSRYLMSNPEDEGGGEFLLTWTGGVGSYPFDLSNTGTHFHFMPPGTAYTSMYIPSAESPVRPSEGSVNITKMENGRVEGTFSLGNVGVGAQLRPQASASGKFKARVFTP